MVANLWDFPGINFEECGTCDSSDSEASGAFLESGSVGRFWSLGELGSLRWLGGIRGFYWRKSQLLLCTPFESSAIFLAIMPQTYISYLAYPDMENSKLAWKDSRYVLILPPRITLRIESIISNCYFSSHLSSNIQVILSKIGISTRLWVCVSSALHDFPCYYIGTLENLCAISFCIGIFSYNFLNRSLDLSWLEEWLNTWRIGTQFR